MELILIRHGETEENANKVLLGHLNPCLNKNGLSQSIEIADKLRQEAISGIYTSDLLRAVQSSEYIKRDHPTAHYQEDRRLRERNYGCFNGTPFDVFLEYEDGSAFSKPKNGENKAANPKTLQSKRSCRRRKRHYLYYTLAALCLCIRYLTSPSFVKGITTSL